MNTQTTSLENIRHSLAHLLATAALEHDPHATLGVGPVIDNGFYYDIQFSQPFSENMLPKLEKRMRGLMRRSLPFTRQDISPKDARAQFANQPFKLELIDEIETKGEAITLYKTGDVFVDLCRGGHVENTKEIPADAFALTHIAGAYWKGDEKNPMLTRIYGLAFETKQELEAYRAHIEEAKKRDHRKVGKELGLFVFSDLIGSGLPIYTPKGAIVRREIIRFSNELQSAIDYQEVHTPNINKADLFKVSGHYEKYREDMFRVVSNYSEEEYFLKPMNCPQHTQIYASTLRSYKDLPLRFADFSNLYRDEKPGELSGLTRLRCFCQDDGHSFCREDQIKEEFSSVLNAIKKAMEVYGMTYTIRLSLWDPMHPENYLGDASVWEKSQTLLETILIENNIEYYKTEGEAAIYGPKMDLISHDSLGRKWQISTIQLDFIMPQRFKLVYTDSDGKEKTPVMIHRALVGSPERFLGILIEHYAGNFPTWLSPLQVDILPVSEKHHDYAKRLAQTLRDHGIRTQINDNNETLGKKVRQAKTSKTPYFLVLGEQEIESQTIAVESRDEGKLGAMTLPDFIEKLREEIRSRSHTLTQKQKTD